MYKFMKMLLLLRFVTSFEPEFKNDETIMLLLSGIYKKN